MDHLPDEVLDVDVISETPKMYAVIIHNDSVTTMDFVVELLTVVFDLPALDATELMMYVHENGQAVAGVYIYDIAASKKRAADKMSRENKFPLEISLMRVSA